MPPFAALALAALLLDPPPASPPAAAPSAVPEGTAEVCAVGHGAPRRDPLLAFLARVENAVAEAKERPLSPPRKAHLLKSLDEKVRRVRARRDYLNRRLSEIRRDLSDLDAFESRATLVRPALESAPAEPVGQPATTRKQ